MLVRDDYSDLAECGIQATTLANVWNICKMFNFECFLKMSFVFNVSCQTPSEVYPWQLEKHCLLRAH